jgi:CO/xanthine dehydrogenase FAD-binding subunit
MNLPTELLMMNEVQYFDPKSVEEALQTLKEYGSSAVLMAGGTDLILDVLKRGKARGHIINLSNIAELAFISNDDGVQIGAGTIFRKIGNSPLLRHSGYEMLSEAAGCVGSRQIRNAATIGGNICNALPCADSAPALTAAEAVMVIQGIDGKRQVLVEEFITRPGKTILQQGEVVTAFILPELPVRTGSAYKTHTTRKALDLTVVGVAVRLSLEPGGDRILQARIALGNVSPAPLRAKEAEAVLEGQQVSESLMEECADLAVKASRARDSAVRASAQYRTHMVHVLTKRCAADAYYRARMMKELRPLDENAD